MCSIAIVLNVLFIFAQLQCQGTQQGVRLGLDGGRWPDASVEFGIAELIFNLYFVVELLIKVFILRTSFWFGPQGVDKLHVFDTVLVLASCADIYSFVSGRNFNGMNLNMLRPFRFLKLLRTLRVIRSVTLFKKLNVLVSTVAASFMALFWSIVLLAVVMLMAALFLCQSLSSAAGDDALPMDTRVWIFKMYGTSARAFYTVFELTFSGGWPNYARTLVEEVHTAYALFFMVYIIAVTFAMFRIITALFLRDTLALASSDAEAAIQEKMKQKERYADKLMDFFVAADTSGDGLLTLTEFKAILVDDVVRTWLSIMEVDVHDAEELFAILDNGDGMVSCSEFVGGILRLKGGASSQDVLRILHNSNKMMLDISALGERVSRVDAALARPSWV